VSFILQVHEKSVLLALLPAAFLLPASPLFVAWLQMLGCFTMFPLLRRDGLCLPYIACTGIYLCLVLLMAEEDRDTARTEGQAATAADAAQTATKKASSASKESGSSRSMLPTWVKPAFIGLSALGESIYSF
jgi:hypothetical protein